MNAEQYRTWLMVTRGYLTSGVRLERIPKLITQLLDDPMKWWRQPDNATFYQFVTRKDEYGLGHDWQYLEKVCSIQPDVWQRVLEADLARPGRRRTEDEQHHAQQIVEITHQHPELSTRQIAEQVGVSQRMVVTAYKVSAILLILSVISHSLRPLFLEKVALVKPIHCSESVTRIQRCISE